MTDDRLTARDWVDAGLKALARSGFTALKADTLSKALGVSRGSFYWHFADVGTFHAAVLQHWREVTYENVVQQIEGAAENRLAALLDRAFRADFHLERAVRSWATVEAKAGAMVEAVDAKRLKYIRDLLVEGGLAPAQAAARARILYWAYLGHGLSANKPKPAEWRRVLDELARLATAQKTG
ncbi:MAG: TetR/AcrR family transcriptional regulator [Alphaproteobacteria bacterium]|jgi:AcrR family transcriptional regulator